MKKEDISDADQQLGLSSEELSMLRARSNQLEDRSRIPPPENKNQSKVVKLAKKNTHTTIIALSLVFSVIAVSILLWIYLSGTLGFTNKRDYRFVYNKFGAREETVKWEYEEIVIDGVLYVDMNKLASFAGFTVSGSEESMKYIASEGNYVKFTNDSEYAVINATKVTIPASAIIGGGKCLVPYTVISKAIAGGIEFKLNDIKHTVNVTRLNYKVDDIVYNEDIIFSYEKFTVVQAIQSTAGVSFEYNKDISEYLSYIAPEDTTPYLLLVNGDNPLGENYAPDSLANIPAKYAALGDVYSLQQTAREALCAMMAAMEKDIKSNLPYVTSAYRSYSYQYDLFEKYVKKYTALGMSRAEAEAEVCKTSARPGASEHQSGLCVDFMTSNMTSLSNEFESSAAFDWLSKNAYKYGFILRYPKDKTEITSYDYESWHYRFVGRDAATEIYLSGLCLEEYIYLL